MSDQSKETLGGTSQRIVLSVLDANGYTVYQSLEKYVSGDFRVIAPDGRFLFVDAKGKSQSTYYRRGRSEEHGIDRRTYNRYLDIVSHQAVDGLIAVYERAREISPYVLEPSSVVLLFRLEDVYRIVDEGIASYGKGGMVYWRRDSAIAQYPLIVE